MTLAWLGLPTKSVGAWVSKVQTGPAHRSKNDRLSDIRREHFFSIAVEYPHGVAIHFFVTKDYYVHCALDPGMAEEAALQRAIQETQAAFAPLGLTKPPLTDKLLARPPFRYLHDLITETAHATGFAKEKGVLQDKQWDAANVTVCLFLFRCVPFKVG